MNLSKGDSYGPSASTETDAGDGNATGARQGRLLSNLAVHAGDFLLSICIGLCVPFDLDGWGRVGLAGRGAIACLVVLRFLPLHISEREFLWAMPPGPG